MSATLTPGGEVRYFETDTHRFRVGRYQGRVQVGPRAGDIIVRHGDHTTTITPSQVATGPRTAARAAAQVAGGFTSAAAVIGLMAGLLVR